MRRSGRIVERLIAGSLIAVSCVGCSNMNNTQKGAAVSGAGGTVVGAIVGKQLGNTGAGAAIGAVTGLAAGALVGKAEGGRAKSSKQLQKKRSFPRRRCASESPGSGNTSSACGRSSSEPLR